MSTSPSVYSPEPQPNRIALPGIASLLLVVAVVFLPVGAFLATINAKYDFDWAIFQTQLGTAIFWMGVASLIAGLLLVGIRAIAQRHLDLLLRAQRPQRAE